MKINCKYYKGKNSTFLCETCTYFARCDLTSPTTKKHSLLLKEIQYWLNKLEENKQNLYDYNKVFDDIKNHKYSIPVNVYGSIKYAPKKNVFDVFIRKPEHVIYGWNYNRLLSEKDDLLEKLQLLNRKELNMRKILEKGDVKC